MNHLAHFLLAGDEEEMIVGALLGDYIKGPLRGALSPGVEDGVRLHRRIDAFTDTHPSVRHLKCQFVGTERRLSGIVIDVYYDHLLARQWLQHDHRPLRQFSDAIYRMLNSHAPALPPAAGALARRLIEHDLLVCYADVAVVHGVLSRIGERLDQSVAMQRALDRSKVLQDEVARSFADFFPQLRAFAQTLIAAR